MIFQNFRGEEEFLFLPFSFFKITKVELKQGSKNDPHIIHLLALNSDEPIEEMFYDFHDYLSPEGLDLLVLKDGNTKIDFNELFKEKTKAICSCECIIL